MDASSITAALRQKPHQNNNHRKNMKIIPRRSPLSGYNESKSTVIANIKENAWFQASAGVNMIILWDFAKRRWKVQYRRFGTTFFLDCLILGDQTCCLETSVWNFILLGVKCRKTANFINENVDWSVRKSNIAYLLPHKNSYWISEFFDLLGCYAASDCRP